MSSLNSISVPFTDKVTFHAVLLVESVTTPKNGSAEVILCTVFYTWSGSDPFSDNDDKQHLLLGIGVNYDWVTCHT